MAEATKEDKGGQQAALTKKSRPTNCAQTNTRIYRKNWYYKNGKYFASKAAAKDYFIKLEQEKAQAAEEAKAKAEEEAKAKAEAAAAEASAETASEPAESAQAEEKADDSDEKKPEENAG